MPRTFALLVAALVASPAIAAPPRIVVLPFTGPGANAARNQVVGALCDSATCVPAAKVGNKPKPDWKKLKKEKVDYAVGGAVTRYKKKFSLDLQVLNGPGKPKLKRSFPVDAKGRLGDAAAGAVGEAVLKAVGASGEGRAPEPVAEPVTPPPSRTEPVATRTEPRRQPEPEPRAEEPPARSSSAEVSRPADEPFRPKRKDPLFTVEVGPDLFGRWFAYTGVQTRNLRSYSAPLVVAPRLRAELFPLATVTRGFAAGLGVEAAYALALGLQSRSVDGPPHPTSLTRFDVAAKLRLKPGSGEAAIVPTVGYRNTAFRVGQASDGTMLDGLPGITYSALLLGVGGELPVADDKLTLFARVCYLPVLSSGEIISPSYFAAGTASGFDITAGAAYKVLPSVEVRLTGLVTRYGLTFTTADTDVYVATGASDLNAGANLSVRYIY
jgi:hypothetical protein